MAEKKMKANLSCRATKITYSLYMRFTCLLVLLTICSGCAPKSDPLLCEAARDGNAMVVETLLTQGKNVNSQDENGWTPLMWASSRGHTEIVELLISKGAKVNILSHDLFSALILASLDGHVSVVEKLVPKGANLNLQEKDGNTALMAASYRGHIATVRFLISRNADFRIQNQRGETALILAVKGNYLESVKSLTRSPHWLEALKEDLFETTKALIKAGADSNQQDRQGKSALMYAKEKRDERLIRLLSE